MVGPLPRTAVMVRPFSSIPIAFAKLFLHFFHITHFDAETFVTYDLVKVGAGSTPPGVDLDRVAASISSGSLASLAAATAPATGPPNPAQATSGPPSSRQFGGRIAVAISGAAQNLKSR